MIWLERFLFQGRPPDSGLAPAYDVVLGSKSTDGFGAEVVSFRGPLTADQAAEVGYPIQQIGAEINQQTLAGLDALRGRVNELEQALELALAELENRPAVT